MRVHLIDGTYELFRHFYALPPRRNRHGEEIGAVRGVVVSLVSLLEGGATHLAIATDQVIESFRNRLWPGYKTGDGIDPALWRQFGVLEETLADLGFVVWPMVEYEADDGLASGARVAARDPRVTEVLLCTPDKDLAQCVVEERVVLLDRRRGIRLGERGVVEKFGVPPTSIPDYLALVGDSADGYPGIAGFGAKASAALLGRFGHLERIPLAPAAWPESIRGRNRLAARLNDEMANALLFRTLARLVRDAPIRGGVDDWAWAGPAPGASSALDRLDAAELALPPAALRATGG